MKDRLLQAVGGNSVDYLDVRYEIGDMTRIHYRRDELESMSSNKGTGGIVRACHKGGWGVTTFDSLDDLTRAVSEACECARMVGRKKTRLAKADEIVDAEIVATMKRDPRGVPMADKAKMIAAYNEIIMAGEGVETSDVSYKDEFSTVYFASSRGAYFREDRPTCALSLSATARDGSLVQRASEGKRSKDDFDELLGQEELAAKAAKRAGDLLKAPARPGGKFSVVLDPEMAGVFIHEAFGHLSEADHLDNNKKLRRLMHIGRKVGSKILNVVDDGTWAGKAGTHAFDDEGTPTKRNYLIKRGKLVGHLHMLATAGKMKAKPTGNARAGGMIGKSPPLVRMTNTYIEPGSTSTEEMFAGVEKGIYACGMFGGNTQMELFTFSAAYGHLIENGRVGPLIRDVMLAGNVFKTMHAIDAIGDDLTICERGGQCGKGGQGVLVTLGSPHLRIRDVVVGGRQRRR